MQKETCTERAVDWRTRIRQRLSGTQPRHDIDFWIVPGLTLEESRRLRQWFPPDPVPAAVLVPLVERESGLTVLLTQRATQLKNHAGQISFPGGRIEPHDEGPRAAALREAWEEIGLEPDFVSVVGYLPDHVTLSGFRITPVVGFVRPGFELQPNTLEVHDAFEVPLSYVFDPANHRRLRRVSYGESEFEQFDILYGERNIWGATAGMLLTFYRLCCGTSDDPGAER